MNFNIFSWTPAERAAAGRHAVSAGGGALAAFAVIGFISQGDASTGLDAIKQIAEGAGKMINGLVLLAGILAPAYAGLRAKFSASPGQQVKQASEAAAKEPEIAKTLINNVSQLPGVTAVVATPEIARDTSSAKVVAETNGAKTP